MDWFVIIPFLFIIFVIAIIMLQVVTTFQTQTDPYFTDPTAKAALVQTTTALQGFDTVVVLLFIGAIIGTVISGFFLNTHPVFFIMSLILTIILGLFAGAFSNIAISFGSSEGLSSAASSFTMSEQLFTNLPVVTVIASFLGMVILYAKRRGAAGQVY